LRQVKTNQRLCFTFAGGFVTSIFFREFIENLLLDLF